MDSLGLGIGWRPELASAIDHRTDLGFVELMAERLDPRFGLPAPVRRLQDRGVKVVLHSTALSLGSAERLDERWLDRLARLAENTQATMVSDHVCFVRAGGREAGHLMPVPFSEAALEVLCEHVARAQQRLPVPLALENIAAFVRFPGGTMEEPRFLSRLLERTGAALLLDLSNLHANAQNLGFDPLRWLDEAPLHRLAYVHLAGGARRGPLYHDTHQHPLSLGPLALLADLARRVEIPSVMLERDGHFPPERELFFELDAIAEAA